MKNVAGVIQLLNQIPRQKRFVIGNGTGNGSFLLKKEKTLHLSAQQNYPVAAALPIPPNIDSAESTRFSPQRSRDISATAILSHQSVGSSQKLDITLDNSNNDPHVDSYDCFGAISLNSAMQSNVPSPFGGLNKFTHLNMPGGQWSQENKFMSHDLQSSHYMNLRREARSGWSTYDQDASNAKGILSLIGKLGCKPTNLHEQIRKFSTDSEAKKNLQIKESTVDEKQIHNVSRREQLKRAVKEYGSTVIIFHVGISLISLECFYLLVTRVIQNKIPSGIPRDSLSGIDLMPLVESLGLGTTALSTKVAAGASSFVIAYAIHKVFAPVRISITLASTPLIVRYLRKKGFLKPKPKT